jgi:hypothetical protein
MQSLHGSAISEFPQVSDKNALLGELNVAKAKLYVKRKNHKIWGAFLSRPGGKPAKKLSQWVKDNPRQVFRSY